MSLPRYPEYKSSGVEWLGEVPGHWDVMPFKWAIDRNDGGVWGDDPDGEDDTIVLRSTEQSVDGNWKIEDPAPRKLSKVEKLFALLLEGDLLVTKSSGSSLHIGKTTLVTAEIAALECCYSNFMQRIRTKHSFNPKFAWYVMNNDIARLQFDYLSNSTTGLANLNGTMVGQLLLTAPPLEEQQTIAAFLDRETGKIDALIAEQRRLVELLAEKRQAVISHAVTKGLGTRHSGADVIPAKAGIQQEKTIPRSGQTRRPAAQEFSNELDSGLRRNDGVVMKDSGIEWLGEVPEHWEVKRLRFVAELNPSKSEVATLDKETLVSFLPMDAIGDDGRLNLEREKPIAEVETGYTFFRDGDVTVAKITPCFENGKGAVMRGLTQGIGFGTTELIVARPIASQVSSDYLHSLFTSVVFRKNGEGHMYGAGGQKRVPDDFVRNFEIAFPPLKEQQAIDAFLNTETAKFDTLTAEANRAIELLQERRSALISAAVTGKIDVRRHTGAGRYPVDESIPA